MDTKMRVTQSAHDFQCTTSSNLSISARIDEHIFKYKSRGMWVSEMFTDIAHDWDERSL